MQKFPCTQNSPLDNLTLGKQRQIEVWTNKTVKPAMLDALAPQTHISGSLPVLTQMRLILT
jgi:hypothetical protein